MEVENEKRGLSRQDPITNIGIVTTPKNHTNRQKITKMVIMKIHLLEKNSEKRNQSIWERLSLFKSPIIKFLRAVPLILSFRQIEIIGCWGLNNPMLTGIFYGVQQALSSFPIDSFKIKITPSFHPINSHINLNFQLRLYLFLFAFFAIRFTIHLLYLRLLNKFGSEGINSGKAVK